MNWVVSWFYDTSTFIEYFLEANFNFLFNNNLQAFIWLWEIIPTSYKNFEHSHDFKYSYLILIIYKLLSDLERLFQSNTNNLNTVIWFGLVSLFNGISTLFWLFNAKAILLEEQYWYYLTHSWEDKGVHTFPKGICPKVNVIARLEYELAYYDSAVQQL